MRPVYPTFAAVLLIAGLGPSFEAGAGDHYFSLTKIFPDGKCSDMVLNLLLMKIGFSGV